MQVELKGNGIYENSEHGAELRGAATVMRNDVFCNRLSALSVHDTAQITVSICFIENSNLIHRKL